MEKNEKQEIPVVAVQSEVGEAPTDPLLSHQVEMWKQTIDVQKHFNTLELQVQNFAITVLLAVIGAELTKLVQFAPVHFKVPTGFTIQIPSTVVLLLLGLVVWLAFWFVDRWYFRLLIGAVRHGEAIERKLKEAIPEIALTTAISNISNERWLGSKLLGSLTARFFGGTNLVYIVGTLFLILLIVAQYFLV